MTLVPAETFEITVPGGALTVGRWAGREGAPVVLAAHGITANHTSWAGVAAELAGAVTLIAPDLRGRGRSGGLPGPYGMPAHAADLVAVLDHLQLDAAVVAGHSMGGFVASVLAERHPQRVAGLVLVDGGLPVPAPPGLDVEAALTAIIGPAMERLRMTFPDREAHRDFWRVHPALRDAWGPAVVDYVDYDLVGEAPALRSSVSAAAVRADGEGLLVDSAAATALSRVTVRTELLHAPRGMLGAEPALYPVETVQKVCGDLGHVRTELVPEVNHYTILLAAPGARAVAAAIHRTVER